MIPVFRIFYFFLQSFICTSTCIKTPWFCSVGHWQLCKYYYRMEFVERISLLLNIFIKFFPMRIVKLNMSKLLFFSIQIQKIISHTLSLNLCLNYFLPIFGLYSKILGYMYTIIDGALLQILNSHFELLPTWNHHFTLLTFNLST